MSNFDISSLATDNAPKGWEDRLLKTVTLYSPDGNSYRGKWRKSEDPWTKALSTFKVVGGNNGQVQDLGVNPRTCSFVIYFDGDECDKSAEAMMNSLEEFGAWSINHPVRGRLENQYPTSFDLTHDPTENGNIVSISTNWITSTEETTVESQTKTAQSIVTETGMINGDAIIDFIDNTGTDTLNLRNKIEQGVNDFKNALDIAFIQPISTVKGGIENMESAYNGLVSTMDQLVYDGADVAEEFVTQICYLGQRPAQILEENENRIASYEIALKSILGNEPSGTTAEKKNAASITQTTAIATIGGMALSVINDPGITTRVQAIEAAATIFSNFQNMVDTLDGYSDSFTGLYSEKYFSLTKTFSNLLNLITLCQKYLLNLSVGLKKQKTVYTERPMSAVLAGLTYYDDSQAAYQIISDNKLKPEEIICMDAGKKLVIYV